MKVVTLKGETRESGGTPVARRLRRAGQLPAVVYASYRLVDAEGLAALKAGYHRLEIHYMQAWNNPNELGIEIEGPGAELQPLGAEWLYRAAG